MELLKNQRVLLSHFISAAGILMAGISAVPCQAAPPVLGKDPAAVPVEFEYPELLVTPRASERIEAEAKQEGGRRWTTHLPIQLSALTTLTAGVLQLSSPNLAKDPDKVSGIAGIAVGGGWLALTGTLSALYQPYTSAVSEMGERPKSQRDQLARERLAEERIKRAARLGRTLNWLSATTNLGVNVFMFIQSQPESFSRVMDGIAGAFSLAPYFFKYRWQDVKNEQDDYKKRIYAPIASAAVFSEPATGRPSPGLLLSFNF